MYKTSRSHAITRAVRRRSIVRGVAGKPQFAEFMQIEPIQLTRRFVVAKTDNPHSALTSFEYDRRSFRCLENCRLFHPFYQDGISYVTTDDCVDRLASEI